MPDANPLLDPPTAQTSHAPAPQAPAAEAPNLLLGVLRRWPWLLLGLSVGLVLGLLYHMQQSPVYQSTAQLLVLKNRPELTTGGVGDARVQYVEDYVAPQVILLQSETILKLTAERRLDEQKPFEVPPPEGVPARIAFLKNRFAVVREKETGSNAPSNVLKLSFNAPNPADAPKYLRAIIAAFRDDVTGVYENRSTQSLAEIDAAIRRWQTTQTNTLTDLREAERKLRGTLDPATGKVQVPGISQEEPARVQQRISDSRAAQNTLELRRIVLESEMKQIREAGKNRADRVAVMNRLGIQPERPSVFGDLRDPESMLAQARYRQKELSVRLGPGHPDMIALASQIKALEEDQEKRGPMEDELERYRRRLENEQEGIAAQLKVLSEKIDADEDTARKMAPIQQQMRALEATLHQVGEDLDKARRERDRVAGTQNSGGYEVRDISAPGTGVQVAPVLVRSLLLGAVVGLLLGGGLGLRAELADRSFRSPADIRRRLGLPVLGHVPVIRTTEPATVQLTAALDPTLAVVLRPKSQEAEAIRGLRTQLLFSTQNRDHQVIQVTSPVGGDGKSTLTANLATALASAGKRVVLVDCDFRKPRVHKIFGLPNTGCGLASVVADQADLGDAIQTCEVENLSLLPCGPRPSNPAELLTSPRFQEILNDLRASYDYVLLDTPPVLAVTDPSAVAPRADGVLLVVRMSPEAGPTAERAKEELMAVNARVLGVVVNASSARDMGYGYGYSYQYESQYADPEAEPPQ